MSMLDRRPCHAPTLGLLSDHPLVDYLVRYSIKDGKKQLAVRLINRWFVGLSEYLMKHRPQVTPHQAMEWIVERITVRIGFFRRRMGSRNYRVPYVMSDDRSLRHSIKRLYKLVADRLSKLKFVESLLHETVQILNDDREQSLVLKEKVTIHRDAKNNKGFIHLVSRFKLGPDQSFNVGPAIWQDYI